MNLDCGVPKSFTLKAANGKYAYLDTNRHIHYTDITDFSVEGIEFRVITHEDLSYIPPGKCVVECVRSGLDNGYYLSTADGLGYLTAVAGTPSSAAYHFRFKKVEDNKYKIINLGNNKHLIHDGELKATQNGSCGNDCTFTIAPFQGILNQFVSSAVSNKKSIEIIIMKH